MKKTAFILAILIALISTFIFACGGGGGGADSAMEDNSFTISYNANGAESGTPPVEQKGKGSSPLIISDNIGGMTKSGYLFDGWNEHPNGAGSIWRPGTSYCGDLKLYAMWVPLFSYEIINAGSPAPALDVAQRAPSLSSIRITGLTQWGDHLSSIIIPNTIDGYTVSEIGDYAFGYRANLEEITIPDSVINIGNNVFEGCSNLGNITIQGTVPPALGTEVFNNCYAIISVPQTAVVTYQGTAGWDTYSSRIGFIGASSYRITYDGNGSDGGVVPPLQIGAWGDSPVIISGNSGALTRAGCTFQHWNTSPNGNGYTFYAGNEFYPINETGRVTLYAQWYHAPYHVSFYTKQGTFYSSIDVISPANTIEELPATPVNPGYGFLGWYTMPDGGGNSFTIGSKVTSNMSVYAKWSNETYRIIYKDQGGVGFSGVHGNNYPTSHTYGSNTVLDAPTRERYAFGGWYTDSSCTGQQIQTIVATSITSDITLYAKWIPAYSIIINNLANGTVTASATDTIVPGRVITLTATPKSGYKLAALIVKNGINIIDITTVIEGSKYTFTMPSGDVTVTSIFSLNDVNNLKIGDVVLGNGSYIYYGDFIKQPASYIAISPPVGVVAYKGLTDNYGVTGKVYMVGLNQGYSLKWATGKGYYTEFSTSKKTGEGNWAIITSEDPSGSADAVTNYPAFNYANTYSVTGYSSGWFIPASIELYELLNNCTTINKSLSAIINAGGSASEILMNADYWSSSQEPGLTNSAVLRKTNGASVSDGCGHKNNAISVRVVRALEE